MGKASHRMDDATDCINSTPQKRKKILKGVQAYTTRLLEIDFHTWCQGQPRPEALFFGGLYTIWTLSHKHFSSMLSRIVLKLCNIVNFDLRFTS